MVLLESEIIVSFVEVTKFKWLHVLLGQMLYLVRAINYHLCISAFIFVMFIIYLAWFLLNGLVLVRLGYMCDNSCLAYYCVTVTFLKSFYMNCMLGLPA